MLGSPATHTPPLRAVISASSLKVKNEPPPTDEFGFSILSSLLQMARKRVEITHVKGYHVNQCNFTSVNEIQEYFKDYIEKPLSEVVMKISKGFYDVSVRTSSDSGTS